MRKHRGFKKENRKDTEKKWEQETKVLKKN